MHIPAYCAGSLRVDPGLVLAPMSGVTTRPLRRLLRELNPGAIGLVLTEFVSVEAMTRKVPRTLETMRFSPEEHPLGIQIFGYDPARMRDGARMVEDAGADLVDVNCGCPAPKVVRKGGGCELMRQPDHLRKVLAEIRKAVSIPLTLKMRSGYDMTSRNCVEIATIAEGEGVQALAVHGRTRTQMYRGEADWDMVRQVAAAVKIPVVGSGDVVDHASAEARLRSAPGSPEPCRGGSGAQEGNSAGGTLRPCSAEPPALHGPAGLMIGRGILANPLVFSDIIAGKKTDLKADPRLVISTLSRYAQLLEEDFPPKLSVGRMKQLASQMSRGHEWRRPLLLAKSFAEQCEILKRLGEGFTSLGS